METTRKILIVVENMHVPFDTRVWKEARALQQHGYQVSVLGPRGHNCRRTHEVMDGIHIYRHPTPTEGGSPLGYLWEYAWSLCWEFLFSWWIFFTRGFHVIQGCNPPDDIFLVALPFRLFGVRYIFDHHDASPELYLSKYGRKDLFYLIQLWLERMTYKASHVVIATNGSYRELAMVRGGQKPEDVFVVRNGPDLDTFRTVPPDSQLKYGRKFLVGYVGTMSIQDGLDILLKVAANIKASGRTDVHFTCIGGGSHLVQLRELVKEMNLEDCVDFPGRVSDEHLLRVLSTADVCVNPDKPCTMNDISTMIKIMEYMALGKPIVQFDLREGRYSAGEASLYARADLGVEDFAVKLLWLLDHPEERAQMGEVGRARVRNQLAWKFSIPHLLSAYDRVFSKRVGASTDGIQGNKTLRRIRN